MNRSHGNILRISLIFVLIIQNSLDIHCTSFANGSDLINYPHNDKNYPEILNVLESDCTRLYYDFLIQAAQKQFDQRRDIVSISYQNLEKVREYQRSVRSKLDEIADTFPEKTPLNAKCVGVIECEDYLIEKVVFESRPNLHVTGNLYIPTKGKGPFPAVLQACGHESRGKAAEYYQSVAILLAKNGFVVLVIDTFSQGERKSVNHTQIDIGAMFLGTDVLAYQAWDNIRAIDYLCSRSEVNPEKIGMTGNSGGGTQTMYMMGLDPRVKVAAPSCGLHTRERMFTWAGLADGCHNFANEGEKLLEFADYLILFAPKPVLVLAGERDDYFDIEATAKTVREAKWFYNEFGVLDHLDIYTVDDGHGFHKGLREGAVWWFKKWLKDDTNIVKEPKLTIQPEEKLWVSKNGYIQTEIENSKSIIDINIEQARDLKKNRELFWRNNSKHKCIAKVKELIRYHDQLDNKIASYKDLGYTIINNIAIRKLCLLSRDGFPIPILMYTPENGASSLPATLYLNDSGKQDIFETDSFFMNVAKKDRIVIAADLRGFGETYFPPEDVKKSMYKLGELRKSMHKQNDQHQIAQTALYIGKTLIGERVKDIIDILDHLLSYNQLERSDIKVIAIGEYGPIALHAAAIDSRITDLRLVRSITSFMDIINEPDSKNQLKNVVPGAIKYYDLPDLVNSIYPRRVKFIEPVDVHGNKKITTFYNSSDNTKKTCF